MSFCEPRLLILEKTKTNTTVRHSTEDEDVANFWPIRGKKLKQRH